MVDPTGAVQGTRKTDGAIGLLATIHAWAVVFWVGSAGLSRAAEGAAFGVIVVCAALRARTIWHSIDPRRSAWPLRCYGALIVWMTLATLWRPDHVPVVDALPGRWVLLPFLLVAAEIPRKGLLVAMSIPGLAWLSPAVLLHAGIADLPSLLPRHPSRAFLGLTMLAAAGVGVLAASNRVGPMLLGIAMASASLTGSLLYASRTMAIAIAAATIATPLVASGPRRGAKIAIVLLVTGAIGAISPLTPIASKLAAITAPAASEASTDPGQLRLISGRSELWKWTWDRLADRWIAGHGGDSWSHDWSRRRWVVGSLPSVAVTDTQTPWPTGAVETCRPAYRWFGDAEFLAYQLVVEDQSGVRLDHWFPSEEVEAGSGLHEVRPAIALAAGDAKWRVRGRSASGALGPWLVQTQFVVTDSSAARPLSPIGIEWNSRPTYRWRCACDAIAYEIIVRPANQPTRRQWFPATEVEDADGVCSAVLTDPVADGPAGWWIRHRSQSGVVGSMSPTNWFHIGSPAHARNHAHHLYLQMLYEYGIIGLLLLAATLLVAGIAAVRRGGIDGAAAFALLITTAIVGLADTAMPSFRVATLLSAAIVLASQSLQAARAGHLSPRAPRDINP